MGWSSTFGACSPMQPVLFRPISSNRLFISSKRLLISVKALIAILSEFLKTFITILSVFLEARVHLFEHGFEKVGLVFQGFFNSHYPFNKGGWGPELPDYWGDQQIDQAMGQPHFSCNHWEKWPRTYSPIFSSWAPVIVASLIQPPVIYNWAGQHLRCLLAQAGQHLRCLLAQATVCSQGKK